MKQTDEKPKKVVPLTPGDPQKRIVPLQPDYPSKPYKKWVWRGGPTGDVERVE